VNEPHITSNFIVCFQNLKFSPGFATGFSNVPYHCGTLVNLLGFF